ncbi:PREDICTED: uncharacterized protein LOC109125628 [Camelina sativa]|uniref:Uncharacterized protein LOC109125628 n=1 Tax=Camelina sativa TaxID=90675 RepID=A0ABM1Q8U2_CAMSA|nr:PREDICTED: uncharacterized protein LOC109125628 [Camelina sativa]
MENQILAKDLFHKSSSIIGFIKRMASYDEQTRLYTVRLTNIFNNNPSKTITLPSLIIDQTEHLRNVSVSDDCVVAARFYGSRVILCGLGDSEWTRIDVPCPAFRLSPVMYSDRDSKFYLNSISSDYTGPAVRPISPLNPNPV